MILVSFESVFEALQKCTKMIKTRKALIPKIGQNRSELVQCEVLDTTAANGLADVWFSKMRVRGVGSDKTWVIRHRCWHAYPARCASRKRCTTLTTLGVLTFWGRSLKGWDRFSPPFTPTLHPPTYPPTHFTSPPTLPPNTHFCSHFLPTTFTYPHQCTKLIFLFRFSWKILEKEKG